ncbi:MAG: phage head morphogenesis protein, partial [Clostridiales Family XIII bacterium]|nr:phage head morphogenesis protein [Clostridiales Family XIII bacterium]
MRNSDYWRERAEILEQTRHASTADYVKILEAEYARFAARTNAKIKEWYDRLAANNEISFEKARQLLSDDELAEFHWSVEEYIKYGKQNAVDGRWMKQLENASAKVHISRLEAAKLHAQQQIEALTAEQISGIDELARDVYTETYSRTAFEIQRGIGVGWDISGINGAMLDKVVNKPWTTDNRTFRDRCWTNKIELVDRVHKDIMQAIMTGQNPQLLAQGIADDFDVS